MNEATSEAKPVYDDGEFRKYAPEICEDEMGNEIAMTVCEELDPESGRWEPFLSTRVMRYATI
jgi:hypothetical protein